MMGRRDVRHSDRDDDGSQHRARRGALGSTLIIAVIVASVLGALAVAGARLRDVMSSADMNPAAASRSSAGSSVRSSTPSADAIPAAQTSAAATGVATAPTARASAGATVTGCGRRASSRPVSQTTQLRLPHAVVSSSGQSDTDPLPVAIAPRAGGTWLAWLSTDGRVYLAKLDCQDHLVGTPTSFVGIDLQDVQADASGGVLLLTRRGSCRGGPLCGGASSPCNTMHMIRFDNDGRQVWATQVTNLTSTRGGYTPGALFVWWYQHHGRLAFDGTNYAAYFSVAITVQNGACVDIHEGDRMQVVSPSGALLSGHGSFDVGCSHSWTPRIIWDPRSRRFVMACATDNDCRIAQPAPYRTIAAGRCDGTLFGGDLIPAPGQGYWTAWSQGGVVQLSRFSAASAARTIATSHRATHPHLTGYGPNRMLLTWGVGNSARGQVYSADTGRALGAVVTIAARDLNYEAVKAFPDASVAFPTLGAGASTVSIARISPPAA